MGTKYGIFFGHFIVENSGNDNIEYFALLDSFFAAKANQ